MYPPVNFHVYILAISDNSGYNEGTKGVVLLVGCVNLKLNMNAGYFS